LWPDELGEVMEELIALISNLKTSKFYGELLIKFEAGNIVMCKKTESIKLAVPVSKKSS
jgi:hypothetical protein